jgi:hypothetical protein
MPKLRSHSGRIPVVTAPPVPSGTNPGRIRELLATAQGYAVLGPDRRRVGVFIELDADGERIAIRCDGVFVWRRRVLSLATVARVLPEQRAVVLNAEWLDEKAAAAPEPPQADGNWQERITRYVSPGENEAAEIAERKSPEPTQSRAGNAEQHLLFVSTSDGYRLVEGEGPPPSAGHAVAMPDAPGSFLVAKLGPSPLPNDDRICAYLAPD